MKIINFINPSVNKDIYELLVACSIAGFLFDQTSRILKEEGYSITEKQYKAFNTVLNEMITLDIGEMQHLLGRPPIAPECDDFTDQGE